MVYSIVLETGYFVVLLLKSILVVKNRLKEMTQKLCINDQTLKKWKCVGLPSCLPGTILSQVLNASKEGPKACQGLPASIPTSSLGRRSSQHHQLLSGVMGLRLSL